VPNRAKLVSLLIAVAGFAFILLRSGTVFKAVPWHFEGQVFDSETNTLADVIVSVDGIGTVKRSLVHSSIEPAQYKARTDANGKFVLDFSAADFHLTFSKSNYLEEDYAFAHVGTREDRTNQIMRVTMSRLSKL
jgi:hypothetical protein